MADGTLFGRDTELSLADRFLDRLGDLSAVLLIEGEQGIGKTALWQAAVGLAERRGFRVLRATPAESEARLSYAALSDLIDDVFDEVGHMLPAVQERALAVALLRKEAEGAAEPRVIASGLLALLTAASAVGPVLVAIDDLQWLDGESARALEFAARRTRERIGWLLAHHGASEERPGFELETLSPARVDRLSLKPLSVAALHHLLADRQRGGVPRPLLLRIHEVSGGNPFVALELARAVASSGARTLGDPLPVPQRLQDLLATRLRRLSGAARDAALVVAAQPRPSSDTVVAVLDDSVRANVGIAEAQDAGVLVEEGTRLRVAHPLLASAIYQLASPARRRLVHGRLAAVVSDPEQRARHLGQANAEPDEPTAAEIEAGATAAARRGAQGAAAELFESAARLTPPDRTAEKARRFAAAAAALLAAADIPGARQFGERALALATRGPLRADALYLLAQVAWLDSPLETAISTLEEALREPAIGRDLRARIHAKLAAYQVAKPSAKHAAAAARLLRAGDDPGLLAHVLFSRFWAQAMLGGGADQRLFARALDLERRPESGWDLSSIPLIYLQSTDDQEAARTRYRIEEAWYRERGEEGWLAERRAHLAWLELRAGHWQLADDLIDESCTIAASSRHGAWAIPFIVRALIDAHRGRPGRSRETLSPLLEQRGVESLWFASIAYFALAFLEYTDGNPEACVKALTSMTELHALLGIEDAPPDRSQPFHVESLLALGDVAGARAVLEQLERRARRWPRPWISATLPRTRALIHAAEGDVPAALAAVEDLDLGIATRLPFDLAWTMLVKGRLHRRARQKRRAADALQAALDGFDSLGAPAWAAQAREELNRVGLRHGSPFELTATERMVAKLVARGLSNPEVAQAAFMSRKTVEANLARVYRKLGIRSRTQLARSFADLPRDLPTKS